MRKPPVIHAIHDRDSSRFLRVEAVDLEFSNGEKRTFERLRSSGPGAVIIVPMQDDDTVLLVREYAVGIEGYELGLPKGRLDRGETAEQGANRELKEEVGFGASELRVLGRLAVSPAYMTAVTHVVIARNLHAERLEGDEPEELEVVPWKLADLHHLLEHTEVTDGRSIAALFMAREFLAGRFRPQS
jgi:ADP-ribose diphosphatase